MDIHLYYDNQQSGPFPIESVREMVRLGTVPETAMVWHEGATDWAPLSTLLGAQSVSEPVPASTTTAQSTPPSRSQGRLISARLAAAAQPEAAGSFFGALPGALVYPFKKNGIIILIAGTIFFGLFDFAVGRAFLLAIPVAIFSTGYMFAYMQRIVVTSAQGDQEMPTYPDFSEWYQDIIIPFFQFLALIAVCWGPGWLMLRYAEVPGGEAVGWFLVVCGALYFPMALLGVAMADSTSGMNPMVLIPSILKVPGQYLVACLVLGALVLAEGVWEAILEQLPRIPILPAAISGFVSLFLLTVEMRILGVLYYTNRDRLKWF